MKRKVFVIPIEIQSRELEAKLNLAYVAAKCGFFVVVGDQNEIYRNVHLIEPGYYLDKSVAKTKIGLFKHLKRLGFKVVALCEEGLVYRDTDKYIKERVDHVAYKLVDRFFCWGPKQRDDLAKNFFDENKLAIVGNPRIDILSNAFFTLWDRRLKDIKSKFGEYILVNTNFSRYNKINGVPDVISVLKKRGTLRDINDVAYYDGLIKHLAAIMDDFLLVIEGIAQEFPRKNILVRPHPSESHLPYQELANRYKNVFVVADGNVIPYLMGATAIIHNSCTTGVEGVLLGKKVVSFMPHVNKQYDSFLPNAVSQKANDLEEVLSILKNDLTMKSKEELIQKYIVLSTTSQCSAKIVEFISSTSPTLSVKSILYRIVFAYLICPALSIRKLFRKSKSYNLNKFPGVQLSEVQDLVELIKSIHDDVDDVDDVDGAQIRVSGFRTLDNVFSIVKGK